MPKYETITGQIVDGVLVSLPIVISEWDGPHRRNMTAIWETVGSIGAAKRKAESLGYEVISARASLGGLPSIAEGDKTAADFFSVEVKAKPA